MATVPNDMAPSAGDGKNYLADQSFFTKFSIILALIIIFGFVQFAARGMVDVSTVPVWVHIHGVMMLAWLGLFVSQNVLIQSRAVQYHRQLGWFFSGPYFLALVYVEAIAFLSIIVWAVSKRKNTQWHRRLMFGATIVILEPAFGRLLPLPLLGDWGEWLIMLVQLGFVALIARHDRRVLGQVHPATVAIVVIVIAVHVAVTALAIFPPFQQIAETIAAGG